MWLEGVLARTGVDEPAARAAKLRAFEIILVLGMVSESWRVHLGALGAPEAWSAIDLARPVFFTVVAGFALTDSWRRPALAGLLLGQLDWVLRSFPLTGNHSYLQAYLLALLVLCDPRRPAEQLLALRAIRWLVVLIFFYAGIHKLAHGLYFRGEYFAFQLQRESFATVLQLFVSPEELARFGGELRRVAGEGPYRLEGWGALLLSNGGWIGEIAVAALLLFERTRVGAVVAGLGFVVVTELMAREIHFGILFVNGLLLFLPGAANRRFVAPCVAGFAAMLAATLLGLEGEFH